MARKVLRIGGSVGVGALVEIGGFEAGLLQIEFNTDNKNNPAGTAEFLGRLEIGADITSFAVGIDIHGRLGSAAVIDLKGNDIRNFAELNLRRGGLAGSQIINGGTLIGGAVPGRLVLADNGYTFAGSVTFENVSGQILTQNGGKLDGTIGKRTITVTQFMSGTINTDDPTWSTADFGALGAIRIRRLTGTVDIDGSALGDLSVVGFTVQGFPMVSGDLESAGSITYQGDATGSTEVSGLLDGDVTVSGKLDGGLIEIGGAVGSTATITIGDMGSGASPGEVHLKDTFAGTLSMTSGIPLGGEVNIDRLMLASGKILLTSGGVAGLLNLDGGGAYGSSIVDGGTVSGIVNLVTQIADPAPSRANRWAGDATFTSVTSTGTIKTTGGFAVNDGNITVDQDMAGLIDINGTMPRGGDIVLNAARIGSYTTSGTVSADDVAGRITVEGDLTVSGLIHVRKALIGGAQITCDKLMAGDILIGQGTGTNTLINVVGGLDSSARITINADAGAFNADGDITVGSGPPPATVTFDGAIRVATDGLGNGNLGSNATILSQGCHDNSNPLSIVICGQELGNVTISQSGCTNQVTDPSPDTCN